MILQILEATAMRPSFRFSLLITFTLLSASIGYSQQDTSSNAINKNTNDEQRVSIFDSIRSELKKISVPSIPSDASYITFYYGGKTYYSPLATKTKYWDPYFLYHKKNQTIFFIEPNPMSIPCITISYNNYYENSVVCSFINIDGLFWIHKGFKMNADSSINVNFSIGGCCELPFYYASIHLKKMDPQEAEKTVKDYEQFCQKYVDFSKILKKSNLNYYRVEKYVALNEDIKGRNPQSLALDIIHALKKKGFSLENPSEKNGHYINPEFKGGVIINPFPIEMNTEKISIEIHFE
mgnify:CR=1 FL=1